MPMFEYAWIEINNDNCFYTWTGERLTDADVEHIFKFTGTEEDLDGNIKYEGQHCSSEV